MPEAHASRLDRFDAIQMCFASGSAEKKAVFSEIYCDDIAFEGTMLVSLGLRTSRSHPGFRR